MSHAGLSPDTDIVASLTWPDDEGEGGCLKKSTRRAGLVAYVQEHPFVTDDQLAERFGVSIGTIRLDRAVLNIPEVRERIRKVAENHQDVVRALDEKEVVGDLIELQLNRFAVSEITVGPVHVFTRTGIMRGHFLFAQVNSLAIAMMDSEIAVTAKTELRFYRPVQLGEVLRARVDVIGQRGAVIKCKAITCVHDEKVLEGVIWVQLAPATISAKKEEDYS